MPVYPILPEKKGVDLPAVIAVEQFVRTKSIEAQLAVNQERLSELVCRLSEEQFIIYCKATRTN